MLLLLGSGLPEMHGGCSGMSEKGRRTVSLRPGISIPGQ